MSLSISTRRPVVTVAITLAALVGVALPSIVPGASASAEAASDSSFTGYTDKTARKADGRALVASDELVVTDGSAPAGAGTTYFVDSAGGSDANDGRSPSAAWRTLANVNAAQFGPGDRILLKAGSVWAADGSAVAKEAYDYTVWSGGRGTDVVGTDPTALLAPKGSGSAAAPIVLSSYGTGPAPELNGRGVVNDTLQLTNQQHWDISNVEISNVADGFDPTKFVPGLNDGLKAGEENPKTGDLRGIHVQGENAGTLSGFDIHHVFIHDVSGVIWSIGNTGLDRSKRTGGILFEGLKGDAQTVSQFTDVTIRDSYIANTSFANIMFKQFSGMGEYRYQDVDPGWGDRAVAKASTTGVITEDPDWRPHTNVRITGNFLTNRDTQYGWDSVYVTSVRGATIEDNLIDGAGVSGIELYYSDDIVVQNNEVAELETRANAADSNGIDPDRGTSNILIQGNYVHDSGEGILLCGFSFSTSVVRYNVIQDVDRNYVNPHGDSGVNVIYNNLMYNTQKPLKNNTVGFFESSGTATDYLVAKNPHHVLNNVFVNTRSDVSGAAFRTGFPGVTFTANAYYGPKVTAAAGDAQAIVSDPKLGGDPAADIRNALITSADSPLITSGATVDLAAIAPGFSARGATGQSQLPLGIDFFGAQVTTPPTVGPTTYLPPAGSGLVAGIVVDEYGDAVAGATVTFASGTRTTDAGGRYRIEAPTGTYSLVPAADGYAAGAPVAVTLADRATVNAKLTLGATTATTGTVRGTVTSSGTAVVGATITLSQGGAPVATATTDGAGTFTLPDVAKGTGYAVSAEKTGYQASSKADVEVKAARTVTVDLAIAAEHGETVYAINETFDDETTGAFTRTTDGALTAATNSAVGSISIAEDPARSGNKYLRIAKTSSTSGTLAVYNAAEQNLTGTVTIEARVQRTTTNGAPNQVAMYSFSESGWNATSPSSSTNPSATFGFSGGRIITHNVTGASTVKNAADYTVGRWYTVRNIVDLNTGTFDFYIDDMKTPVLADQPLRTKVDDLDFFEFFVNGSNVGDLLVDYFRVNTGDPYGYDDTSLAAAAATSASGEVALTRGDDGAYSGTVDPHTETIALAASASSPFAKVTVAGTAVTRGETVEVDLAEGSQAADTWTTEVPVVVTAENGAAKTHTVSISRTNPNQSHALRALSIEGYALDPAFDPDRKGADDPYTVSEQLDSTVDSVALTWQRGWAGQQVQVNGDLVAADATSATVGLEYGTNTIEITSDSFPGDFATYVISVTRLAPPDTTAPAISNLPTGTVNAAAGLDLAVTADDPESGIRSLVVTLDGTEVPAVGHAGLAGLSGEHTVTATAVNGAGLESTASQTILVVPADGATKAPGVGTLSNTSGWAYGLHDGNHTVEMNLWKGAPGSIFRLYENGTLIATKVLSSVQSATVAVLGKPNGTYVYTGELINSRGKTSTTSTTVTVTAAAPGKPVVSHDNWDGDGTFAATANMWWGTNATSYTITLDGVVVGQGALSASTPNAQIAKATLSGVAKGQHTLQAVFTNAAGSTSSSSVTMTVTK